MVWSPSIASLLGVTAAVISGGVALYSRRHRNKRMALQFIALEVSLAAWSLAYAVQLGHTTLADQLLWQRISLGLAGFVPTVWLLFALAYTGRRRWLSRNRVAVLLAEPVVWMVCCLTNPLHDLIWREATFTATAMGFVPALEFGLGYGVHITYAYLIVALGIGLLVLHASRVAPAYQQQAMLLLVAVVPPFLSHIAFTLGVSPLPALDLTPFVFALTGLIFGLALFRFNLLHLTPIARQQAFQEVGDGLIIVNSDGEIIDVIGIAAEIIDTTPRIADPISGVFPDTTLEELDSSEVIVSRDGKRRVYQYRVSPLSAHHDRRVGTMIIIRDVTGLYESKQRLSVTNRLLRHNLRNDMTVVLGFASDLEERLAGRDAADARRIREAVERFLELTRKVEEMAQLDEQPEGDRGPIDVVGEVAEIVSEHQSANPDATVTLEAPSSATVDGMDARPLRLAVGNVIENAISHNDAQAPLVTVDVEDGPEEVLLRISDNGPGIPETEKRAIGASTETPLDHSQGLGLWLTHWCAERWGGDLRFESEGTADGSTVTLTIPRAPSTIP